MLRELKELLSIASVRDAMARTASRADAIGLLISAAAQKGHRFTVEGVSQALSTLNPVRTRELSEQELVLVSGGLMASSAPRLCHTESCGGGLAGACPGCCPRD